MKRTGRLFFSLIASTLLIMTGNAEIVFPDVRPPGGNFVRPESDEILTVSPPGFSWWRAAPYGEATYRLRVISDNGDTVHTTEDLPDNIHVPDVVIPAGTYTWIVNAVDSHGEIRDSRVFGSFKIAGNSAANPWIPAEELLSRVSCEHPRLLFPRDQLDEIRSTLRTTRKEAYTDLMRRADENLGKGAA
jgi:hypothetical protein